MYRFSLYCETCGCTRSSEPHADDDPPTVCSEDASHGAPRSGSVFIAAEVVTTTLATGSIRSDELVIPADGLWHPIGGVVTAPGSFPGAAANKSGRLVGSAKRGGDGCQVRLLENGAVFGEACTLDALTLDAWRPFLHVLDAVPGAGLLEYVAEALCPVGATLSLRSVNASLVVTK